MAKLRCPYCNRVMEEEFREIGKDELGRTMQHKFAVCPVCKREVDLDLAEEGIYTSPMSEENLQKVNGNHVLGIISLICAGALIPLTLIPISLVLSIIDLTVNKNYKHTCSILAIVITFLWYFYIFN